MSEPASPPNAWICVLQNVSVCAFALNKKANEKMNGISHFNFIRPDFSKCKSFVMGVKFDLLFSLNVVDKTNRLTAGLIEKLVKVS